MEEFEIEFIENTSFEKECEAAVSVEDFFAEIKEHIVSKFPK